MKTVSRHYQASAGVMLALGIMLSTAAGAATVSMAPFNSSAPDLDITVDITVDGASAYFSFSNNSTGSSAGSSLARVYFESGLLAVGLSNGVVLGGSGTDFASSYPGPGSPPSANNIAWAGEAASFGAGSPPSANGLNVGDTLLIAFDYTGSLGALLDAVTNPDGNSRIAGHVLDCVGGNSCSTQASTQVIPLPAGLPLFLGALAGLGMLRRKRT